MAFRFKRKESVAKATRRLGRDRAEHGLECLKRCERVKAIHCARKDIKKQRAVLRLLRAEIPKRCRRDITKVLREAAEDLAAPRDAYVKARTLKKLARHFKGQLAPGALRHTRGEFRSDSNKEMRRFAKKNRVKRVTRILRGVAKKWVRMKVRRKGWKALAPGVKEAYAKGQEAYRTVLKDPAAENFHQWRKGAKDLRYDVALLRPL